MLMHRRIFVVAAAVILGVLSASAAFAQGGPLRGRLTVDGSSTVYPLTDAVAEEFFKIAPRVQVPVGVSGTGGGFKRFVRGETDISNASRPIAQAELESAKAAGIDFIELPIAYDGLTIVVNPENTWASSMTVEEIRKIYNAETAAKTWADVREGWPNEPIHVFSPGTDSGTFDYFREIVAGKQGAIRADMSVSEDDNVLVRGVAGDKYAIGFFGIAYYLENASILKAVQIDNGNGPVAPNAQTIETGAYAPFSRPLFIYINARSLERNEVRRFAEFYLEKAPELAPDVGYVRLPDEAYRRAKAKLEAKHIGSHYFDEEGNRIHGPLLSVYK